MREILFRGKTLNGEWVKGYYVYDESEQTTEEPTAYIVRLNQHPCGWSLIPYKVIPKILGQFAGLTDKNGTRIFESDIVKITFPNGIIKTDVVKFANGGFLPYIIQYDTFFWGGNDSEVIGNIHDNPELLEVVV